MWIDARQHIASLVAVFLALGVGMLIGGTVPGAGGLRAHEQALIANLERSLDRFELRNRELQRDLTAAQGRWEAADKLNDALLALAFEDRLTGRRINVLAVGASGLEPAGRLAPEMVKLRRLLDRSGADVVSVVPSPEADAGTTSRERPSFDRVVVVRSGRSGDGWERAWEQLARFDPKNSSVILVQPSSLAALPTQSAPRGEGDLLVIDHIDTAAGLLTLLEGLRASLGGHYGLLDGAVGRFPDVQRGLSIR